MNNAYLNRVFNKVKERDPNESEFLQAVKEVLESIEPVIERRPDLEAAGIIERIV